jgi:hypothetical protein
MRRPRHCRRCHEAHTGTDVFAFAELSFAAVLRGHDACSLGALLASLEARHHAGVTEWCPHCARFGVSVFSLLAAGPPTGAAVAEHVLALEERRALLAPHASFESSSRSGNR